jgi:acyl-CoA dehydrogenase
MSRADSRSRDNRAMQFALTDDQQMIRDAAERFLAEASESGAVRRAIGSNAGYDEAAWQRIGAELGWCGIAIAEEFGGLGSGPVELALIQEQAGRRLLCTPFFSTVCLAATLLQEIGTDAARSDYLPRIARGELRASAPLSSWDAPPSAVPDGGAAQVLLLPRDGAWLAVDANVAPLPSWDATRRFAAVDANAAGKRIDDPARIARGLPRALALARLYIAAEQLGGAQQCLDSTVAYVAERKQFGRAIASFQAVKHRCAQMMVAVEATRSMVYGAAALAASDAPVEAIAVECAAAKALASETYFGCAQEAIQLHGGVGFTWDFDPHIFLKRARLNEILATPNPALRDRAAAIMAETARAGRTALELAL